MKKFIVYKATNTLLPNKHYIGWTDNFTRRKRKHLRESFDTKYRKYITHWFSFHIALREFGEDNFDWEIIYETDDNDVAKYMEQYFILEWDSHYKKGDGYNMTDGGEGTNGHKFTQEQIKRNSEAQKIVQANKTPEEKQQQREQGKRDHEKWWNSLTDDEKQQHKKNCSERSKGNKHVLGHTWKRTEEANEKVRRAKLGKKHKQETIEKMKLVKLGTKTGPASDERKRKIGLSKIGRKKVLQSDGTYKMMKIS